MGEKSMIRKLATAAAAGALALTGLAVFGAGTSGAATVITAGAGSHISCNTVKAKATIAPALKDNWVKSQHSGDSDAGFAAIPDTTFASNGPVAVAGKTSVSGCTGTAVQGANTATIKKITVTLTTDPAHPGLANPATCVALVNMAPPAPTDAQYLVSAQFKSGTKGFSIADMHVSNVALAAAGAGFNVSGGTITGSFAGGTSTTHVNVDGKTLTAFLSSSFFTTLTHSNAATAGKPCQASAKSKKGVWGLKAPKGISKIGVASGTFAADHS
jgi:hypothetical protein